MYRLYQDSFMTSDGHAVTVILSTVPASLNVTGGQRSEFFRDTDVPGLDFAANPLTISWDKSDIFAGVHNCQATLRLIAREDGQYRNLLDGGDIYCLIADLSHTEPLIIFSGAMAGRSWKEPFSRAKNYPLEVTFSDFGYLDRVTFTDSRLRQDKIYATLYDVFDFFCNDIFRPLNYMIETDGGPIESGDVLDFGDALNATGLDAASFNMAGFFEDGDFTKGKSVKKVIEDIAVSFGVHIYQYMGKVHALRTDTLKSSEDGCARIASCCARPVARGTDATAERADAYKSVTITFERESRGDIYSRSFEGADAYIRHDTALGQSDSSRIVYLRNTGLKMYGSMSFDNAPNQNPIYFDVDGVRGTGIMPYYKSRFWNRPMGVPYVIDNFIRARFAYKTQAANELLPMDAVNIRVSVDYIISKTDTNSAFGNDWHIDLPVKYWGYTEADGLVYDGQTAGQSGAVTSLYSIVTGTSYNNPGFDPTHGAQLGAPADKLRCVLKAGDKTAQGHAELLLKPNKRCDWYEVQPMFSNVEPKDGKDKDALLLITGFSVSIGEGTDTRTYDGPGLNPDKYVYFGSVKTYPAEILSAGCTETVDGLSRTADGTLDITCKYGTPQNALPTDTDVVAFSPARGADFSMTRELKAAAESVFGLKNRWTVEGTYRYDHFRRGALPYCLSSSARGLAGLDEDGRDTLYLINAEEWDVRAGKSKLTLETIAQAAAIAALAAEDDRLVVTEEDGDAISVAENLSTVEEETDTVQPRTQARAAISGQVGTVKISELPLADVSPGMRTIATDALGRSVAVSLARMYAHTHPTSEVTGLDTLLRGYSDRLAVLQSGKLDKSALLRITEAEIDEITGVTGGGASATGGAR